MTARRGRVLVVDDEEVIASTLREFLEAEGFEVAVAADAAGALRKVSAFEPDLALCDIQLPGLDGLDLLDRLLRARPETLVLMITAYATVENAVAAFRRGAHDYLMKPVIFEELLVKLDRLMATRRLMLENQALRRALHAPVDPDALVGDSPPMRAVKTLIRKVGPTRANVLISGESGTGKELVARALHAAGGRARRAVPGRQPRGDPERTPGRISSSDTSERVHRGRSRPGRTSSRPAGRGTVFLDEIGELPLATQAKLLRVIEAEGSAPGRGPRGRSRPGRGCWRRRTRTSPPRSPRADSAPISYYIGSNVGPRRSRLPALRDRREDIPELIRVLLSRHADRMGKPPVLVDNATVRRLSSAAWKGNVRELDNALERAMILAEGPVLTWSDFPPELVGPPGDDGTADDPDADDLRAALDRFERAHIRRVLDRCGGDKREAARRLGFGLSSLYRKLDESGSGTGSS